MSIYLKPTSAEYFVNPST